MNLGEIALCAGSCLFLLGLAGHDAVSHVLRDFHAGLRKPPPTTDTVQTTLPSGRKLSVSTPRRMCDERVRELDRWFEMVLPRERCPLEERVDE